MHNSEFSEAAGHRVKAFGYIRVSGLGQVDGDGFTRQREAITAFCGRSNLEIVRWFEERGVSGTTEGDCRAAWVDMMAAIQDNGVRTVVVERLDRLARDLMVQEHIIEDVKKRGVDLRSVCEPDLCSNDPTRILFRQIMGAIAQYDKTMIVLKLRGARQRMKRNGERCEGRRPYGWYEGEKLTLQRILEYGGRGLHWADIAHTLNAGGAFTRSGRPWLPNTVRRILERNGRV